MNQTYDEIIDFETLDYLEQMDMDNPPSPMTIKREILESINKVIAVYNKGPEDPPGSGEFPSPMKGDDKYKKLKTLPARQVALILIHRHCVRRINVGGTKTKNYALGMYVYEGADEGIYDFDEDKICALASEYNAIDDYRNWKAVLEALKVLAPVVAPCADADLVAVGNGIYDYGNKFLMPFDPELVFTMKSHVDFIDNAPNQFIEMPDGEVWDVDSWMQGLSDDPEVAAFLWRVLGAVIRPNVPWNHSIWLLSEVGNNGKGTLCRLMRNLLGDGAHTSINLKQFAEQFGLDDLLNASAIITDENDTDTYIDSAATLKSIITGDLVTIDRKFKSKVKLQFRGMMVQCVNSMPRVKDKTPSFYRRLCIVPMNKQFEGCERKYIKDDYLGRKKVLEYVLYKLLATTNCYELDPPKACLDLLSEYKEFNDPVRAFMAEVMEQLVWDLVPNQFLYDLYCHWYTRNVKGKPVGKGAFLKQMRVILPDSPGWTVTDSCRRGTKMDAPERLILDYGVNEWMNESYTGNDWKKRCSPDNLKEFYSGLERVASAVASGDKSSSEED
ncbi:nucleoside triphosphatase [Streptococcus agalactiae]|uniref:DNA primase family protein n=1 Tax=Streptococcus agalactiae TaxID=1311 RepID=UPI0016287151|nr:phage/plasmid primase, P4 family [Streptococcus agalactiae]QNG00701.1 nucleoside triphosphatase [Streptococcus agalactiae]HEO5099890.1 nucleoside triphosphatase [Streptococcus agalactiae]